jgi:flagellar hook protein FlgE
LLDNPVATGTVTYVANLPASDTTGSVSTPSSIQVYDALGNEHQVNITWTQESTTAVPNTWLVNINIAGGGANGADYNTQATVTFNSSPPAGTIESVVPVTTFPTPMTVTTSGQTVTFGTPTPPDVVSVTDTPSGGTAKTYTYTVKTGDTAATVASYFAGVIPNASVGTGANNDVLTLAASDTFSTSSISGYTACSREPAGSTEAGVVFNGLTFAGTAPQNIDFNLGTLNAATGVTQYASSGSTVSVSSISQDGLGEGSYSSIGIDDNGVVSINYTNGSTRKIYQIPIAQFNSPDNLQRGTGGVYTATLASGSANLHLAGTNGAGTISSSSLESSDVDIANEFTTMIQSQQAYSANAKVVTTVNSMLNTIIQAVQ